MSERLAASRSRLDGLFELSARIAGEQTLVTLPTGTSSQRATPSSTRSERPTERGLIGVFAAVERAGVVRIGNRLSEV